MNRRFQVLGGAAMMMSVAVGVAVAQQLTVDINKVSEAGVGEKIGTVNITENMKGTSYPGAGQRKMHQAAQRSLGIRLSTVNR